jgi:processive 1,2-diacylglycerol beta-glucosyltransferase
MARIVILYSSLGSGHKSAAFALQEAFERKHVADVRVEDALDHADPLLRKTITSMYERVSRQAPTLYKMFYEGTDLDDPTDARRSNKILGMIERSFFTELERVVTRSHADAIVCTQQVPALVLQELKREGGLLQPLYLVITDFMVHSSWIISGVDGYFVSSEITRDVLIARGVSPSIIHVTGIPVRLEIADEKPINVMRAAHALPVEGPIITLFGGGIETDRVRHIVTELVRSRTSGMLVVIAGRNEDLLEELADVHSGPHMRLCKLGRIDYVDDLIAASDVVITKSGGLIVSEILARGTPMVIIDPIPGQEDWNADFVSGSGAGIQLRMPESAPPTVLYLIKQSERLALMRAAARVFGRPNAAMDIATRVLADLR